MEFDKLVLHVIEMSSRWLQYSTPRSWRGHSNSEFSVPWHSTSSSHICPVPAPNVLPMGSPDRLNKRKYRNAVHYHMRRKTYIVQYNVLPVQIFQVWQVKITDCRGLVTLHWSLVGAGLSRGDLCCMSVQLMSSARCLASQSRLSCRSEHVFFSYKGRMKAVKTFVREKRVMLLIGAASYLMWKAFRGSGNSIEGLYELGE